MTTPYERLRALVFLNHLLINVADEERHLKEFGGALPLDVVKGARAIVNFLPSTLELVLGSISDLSAQDWFNQSSPCQANQAFATRTDVLVEGCSLIERWRWRTTLSSKTYGEVSPRFLQEVVAVARHLPTPDDVLSVSTDPSPLSDWINPELAPSWHPQWLEDAFVDIGLAAPSQCRQDLDEG